MFTMAARCGHGSRLKANIYLKYAEQVVYTLRLNSAITTSAHENKSQ